MINLPSELVPGIHRVLKDDVAWSLSEEAHCPVEEKKYYKFTHLLVIGWTCGIWIRVIVIKLMLVTTCDKYQLPGKSWAFSGKVFFPGNQELFPENRELFPEKYVFQFLTSYYVDPSSAPSKVMPGGKKVKAAKRKKARLEMEKKERRYICFEDEVCVCWWQNENYWKILENFCSFLHPSTLSHV